MRLLEGTLVSPGSEMVVSSHDDVHASGEEGMEPEVAVEEDMQVLVVEAEAEVVVVVDMLVLVAVVTVVVDMRVLVAVVTVVEENNKDKL